MGVSVRCPARFASTTSHSVVYCVDGVRSEELYNIVNGIKYTSSMRIRNIKVFLDKEVPAKEVRLNDCCLVVDGQNYLYNMYKHSNLESLFGCECDRFANFLREELSMFKRANVRCYFLFKGGRGDNERSDSIAPDDSAVAGVDKYKGDEPLLSRDVYRQVLAEMEFDCVTCVFESKSDCVALARKLDCPVLAFDIEYFFSGVRYMPFLKLKYNSSDNSLRCQQYELDTFMEMYKFDNAHVAMFLTLFDEKVFPKEWLDKVLKKLRLPLSYATRHSAFFQWLSRNGENAMNKITPFVTRDEILQIKLEIERKVKTVVGRQEVGGLAVQYFVDRERCLVTSADPDWFAKGVVCNFIPIPYINMYKWGTVDGSWSVEDGEATDPLLISAPVFRYAFDLLTNFDNQCLVFRSKRPASGASGGDKDLKILQTVRKPNHNMINIFENGWNGISSLKLFEHFLSETIQISDVNDLQQFPSDARMLIVSLVYFARQRGDDIDDEVHAVLLCLASLAVLNIAPSNGKHARAVLEEEFSHSNEELSSGCDRWLLHSLVQFQHCLRQINFLNTLCGAPLPPTTYSKVYNATFVYKVLHEIKKSSPGNARKFLQQKLQHVPMVLTYFCNIVDLYNNM